MRFYLFLQFVYLSLNLHNAYFQGVKCGIYGANCPEWIMNMEACNAQGLYRVPLYDTLEVSMAFAEEKKIPKLLKTFPNAGKYLKTLVSFGKVTPEQKQEGHNQSFDLPVKKKSDVCTIMYTSGTTGDPKGVLITNESIITLLAGIQQLLKSCNEKLNEKDVYLSYLPLAHIFARVIEEAMIMHGASIVLLEDIGELRPTIFVAVPRVLDRVYNAPLSRHVEGFLRVVTCALISFNDMVRSC
ncbi:Long chain acyl-CoA synthetase 4 [Glycine soja]